MRAGHLGFLDPIGIADEKDKPPDPIDSFDHLGFILEHIMNK
jgi:hypothetical protein